MNILLETGHTSKEERLNVQSFSLHRLQHVQAQRYIQLYVLLSHALCIVIMIKAGKFVTRLPQVTELNLKRQALRYFPLL